MAASSPTPTWRYERKFLIEQLDKHEIESVVRLHPAMFSEVFHERIVNNLYLDTPAMDNFSENVQGRSQRLKVRIRWYGESMLSVEEPVLEVKLKSGALGRKISFPLQPFSLAVPLSPARVQEIIAAAGLNEEIRFTLRWFDFSLMNRYRRRYFLSADARFRVTIDSDVRCTALGRGADASFLLLQTQPGTIVELKYASEYDEAARDITNALPFRMTKNSKYVRGIEEFIGRHCI